MWAPIGIGILNANDLVIESVNDKFIEIAGNPFEQLVGHNYWVPFAEAAPYYADALNRVAQEGEVFSIKEVELMLIQHGQEEIIYVTFVYMPFKVTVGGIQKVVVWVFENTDQVAQRKLVEEQVTERTQELAALNEKIAVSNEELEESNTLLLRSNDSLNQFAYVASHDLQEPLRKIQQFGDLLQDQYAEPLGEDISYLNRMQLAASRMSTLIRDLLDYYRISSGRNTDKPVALTAVVESVLDVLELAIMESNAQVQLGLLPIVSGDVVQLDQLF